MKNSYQEILDPNNILLDDRSISDSIILLKKLATAFSYYNRKNKLEGNFSSMIETDQSFLIAEISEFSIEEFNKKRLNFTKGSVSLIDTKYISNFIAGLIK